MMIMMMMKRTYDIDIYLFERFIRNISACYLFICELSSGYYGDYLLINVLMINDTGYHYNYSFVN